MGILRRKTPKNVKSNWVNERLKFAVCSLKNVVQTEKCVSFNLRSSFGAYTFHIKVQYNTPTGTGIN